MKIFIILLTYFFLALSVSQGQSYYKEQWARENSANLTIGIASMRSERGWENGFELNYRSTKNFQIGVFSYTDMGTSERESTTYQGLQVDLPILQLNDQMRFGLNGRVGIHGKRFLSFLPTVSMELNLNEKITVASSVGVSDRLPVFAFKLNFRLARILR